jgi:hypothetical protein
MAPSGNPTDLVQNDAPGAAVIRSGPLPPSCCRTGPAKALPRWDMPPGVPQESAEDTFGWAGRVERGGPGGVSGDSRGGSLGHVFASAPDGERAGSVRSHRTRVMGGVATWEREIMLERQREGIAKAKAAGKYKGRAPTVRQQAEEIRAAIAAGKKRAHVARRLGVARSSIYRMLDDRPTG